MAGEILPPAPPPAAGAAEGAAGILRLEIAKGVVDRCAGLQGPAGDVRHPDLGGRQILGGDGPVLAVFYATGLPAGPEDEPRVTALIGALMIAIGFGWAGISMVTSRLGT